MKPNYKRSWLTKVEIERKPGELYLTRYVIVRWRWFGMYIHKFHQSDYPVPHDHPWPWLSIPLSCGYLEHMVDGTIVHRIRFLPLVRGAREFHWIEILKPTWTFFMYGPRIREWGFMTKDGWVNADEHNEGLGDDSV